MAESSAETKDDRASDKKPAKEELSIGDSASHKNDQTIEKADKEAGMSHSENEARTEATETSEATPTAVSHFTSESLAAPSEGRAILPSQASSSDVPTNSKLMEPLVPPVHGGSGHDGQPLKTETSHLGHVYYTIDMDEVDTRARAKTAQGTGPKSDLTGGDKDPSGKARALSDAQSVVPSPVNGTLPAERTA